MSLDRRGVDQHLRRRAAGRCQGMENIHPNPFGRPAHEAIVQRLLRTIDRRRVDPASARLQHMNDPADDAAVIDPWFAAGVGWMRRKPRELPLIKPELIAIHDGSPFGDLESQNDPSGNPLYGSGA